MRQYEAPSMAYSLFSSENIVTVSSGGETKTNLNEWLEQNNVGDDSHVVVNMGS